MVRWDAFHNTFEEPLQAIPGLPVGLLPLLRHAERRRAGIVRRPVAFEEAPPDQGIHQAGGGTLLDGEDLVKSREVQLPLPRHGVQDDELVKREAPANRLIPAAAPYLPGKAHDDFKQLPAVFIEIR